jgi:DNA adenine methylase
MEDNNTTSPQPVLKWAGGKSQLIPALMSVIPPRFGTYYEPFAGGAALFFALVNAGRITHAVLSDLNADLLNLYRVVQTKPSDLVSQLKPLEARYLRQDTAGRKRLFYQIRAQEEPESVRAAARLVFLNKTCFNGLFRVNRSGKFNVPHGRYSNPSICNEKLLMAASRALAQAEIRGPTDFAAVTDWAKPGDLVYFDPPYQPLSQTSSFTGYTSQDFGWAAQVRLKDVFECLVDRGATAMLSNSAHQDVVSLYDRRHEVRIVEARRSINSRGDRRGKIGEVLVVGRPAPRSVDTEVQTEPILQIV